MTFLSPTSPKKDRAFIKSLTKDITISSEDEHAKRALKHAEIQFPRKLTAAQIRSILDSKNYNISFADVSKMKQSAGRWLSTPFKRYFTSMSASQSATLSAIKAVRNFLAHRSDSSKKTMQSALTAAHLPAQLKRGQHQIGDVGSYLVAKPPSTKDTRIDLYITHIESISSGLCP